MNENDTITNDEWIKYIGESLDNNFDNALRFSH